MSEESTFIKVKRKTGGHRISTTDSRIRRSRTISRDNPMKTVILYDVILCDGCPSHELYDGEFNLQNKSVPETVEVQISH